MTDREIICAWMEPRPERGPWDCRPWRSRSPNGWWQAHDSRRMDAPNDWYPKPLDLDSLHEVEARLTNEQWAYFMAALLPEEFTPPFPLTAFQAVTHAAAEQKIAALATVLRPIVEAADQPQLALSPLALVPKP
jgi:hypothetical protein